MKPTTLLLCMALLLATAPKVRTENPPPQPVSVVGGCLAITVVVIAGVAIYVVVRACRVLDERQRREREQATNEFRSVMLLQSPDLASWSPVTQVWTHPDLFEVALTNPPSPSFYRMIVMP